MPHDRFKRAREEERAAKLRAELPVLLARIRASVAPWKAAAQRAKEKRKK
jgi:hypothetical protein